MNAGNSSEDALYDAARRLADPAARAAFLDAACAGNPALRERLEKLLSAAPEADDFFRRNAVDLNRLPPLSAEVQTLITPPAEQPGEMIGRYKLLQEIGEGGFGTVWMAEQIEPVSRRVALKIIKLGMDTREVIARFEAERQALAMMDHPNIAKVLDAGATDKGRPFFVMELVKGMPITQDRDEAGLGTRERLALFGDVCAAINHAHQKGVIHRDIKPSNVMITLHGDRPVVKVIDFGIAKATQGKLTDKTLFTRFEQFVGTPVYMSPEQASMSGLDIDTRSDIYALGILLYELLTGKPPFDAKSLASAGYEEMRRIIREVEPPKPSSRLSTVAGEERTQLAKARHIAPEKLNKLVEPDLDWIVMKAIEKDRARRYETANGLALDIKRFLADEPVSATPPSAGYRFRKFARRNKTALRVTAVIALLLVAATAVSVWLAMRATKAESLARQRLREVEEISDITLGILSTPDPGRDGRTITVAELLDRAVINIERHLAREPAVRARLQHVIGMTFNSLGLHRDAIPVLEKAKDYYLTTHGTADRFALDAMTALAVALSGTGRNDAAMKIAGDVFKTSRTAHGDEDKATRRAAGVLGVIYGKAGRFEDEIALLEKYLEIASRVEGPESADAVGEMLNLASAYTSIGRVVDGQKMTERVLEVSRRLHGPEHQATLMAINNLAADYGRLGRHAEALKMFEELLEVHRRLSGPAHPDTLLAMTNVAGTLSEMGRKDEAAKMNEQVRAIESKNAGSNSTLSIQALMSKARKLRHEGKPDAAIHEMEKAVGFARKLEDSQNPVLFECLLQLSEMFAEVGRHDEAIRSATESVEHWKKSAGPEGPATLAAMTNLAMTYSDAGRVDDAIALQERTLALKRRILPAGHHWTTNAINNLGNFYTATGRQVEAIQLAKEAVGISRKHHGDEHPTTIMCMNGLAVALAEDGKMREAIPLQEKSLEICRRVLPADDRFRVAALKNLATMYDTVDLAAEAKTLRAELERTLDPKPDEGKKP